MTRQFAKSSPRPQTESGPTALVLGVIAVLLASQPSIAACPYPDTLYVNYVTCSSTGPGTCPENAFCSITAALNSFTNGTNKVLAVMGTGGPNWESVTISDSDSGSVNQPLVLFARGPVTLDQSELVTSWTQDATDATLYYTLVPGPDPCTQVVNAAESYRRYRSCNTGCTTSSLPAGQCLYDASPDRVYIRAWDSSRDYTHDSAYLCVRQGINVRTSNVVVDGIQVLRSAGAGFKVDGGSIPTATRLRNVKILNSVAKQSRGHGVDIEDAIFVTVKNNSISEGSSHGIFVKSKAPATGSLPVEECTVIGNSCFLNDDQSLPGRLGGRNGIRIGDGVVVVGKHLVEGNKSYMNEDSGFEINGSNDNTFRYNQSWQNGDHGFDHLLSSGTVHIGDLAYGNDGDGFSNENNSSATSMHNCVMVDNGRSTNRQDYELEVLGTAADNFVSDYNVIYRPSRSSSVCYGTGSNSWDEAGDTTLIAWRAQDNQETCKVRCNVASTCFGTAARFAAATSVNPSANELHSKQGETQFVDVSASNFRPFWSSPVVDAADTTITGWVATDLFGFARHDCAGKSNTGKPAGTFADIGPFEYDDGMSPVDSVGGAYNAVSIGWTGSGRYGNASYKPIWYRIYVDEVLKRTKIASNMSWPGTIIEAGISASPCHTHSVYVTTLAESTSASHKDVTQSNSVSVTSCCSPRCSDGRELSSRRPREENADFPLALEWSGANPSRGVGMMAWAIPRAQAGVSYDLSLFDVAGRKVSTIAKGMATPGKFTQELWFRSRNEAVLPNGVFFLRLRVGSDILNRTLVLTR